MTQLDEIARRRRAHATIDRLQAALMEDDMDAFAGFWALDGTMSFPFAPSGSSPVECIDSGPNAARVTAALNHASASGRLKFLIVDCCRDIIATSCSSVIAL
jgi:hypothetical protein